MANDRGGADNPEKPRKAGRPRCQVSGKQVSELRTQGVSWRQIASQVGVSPASCMRVARAFHNHENACQNLAPPEP
jgi:hypothetical protein